MLTCVSPRDKYKVVQRKTRNIQFMVNYKFTTLTLALGMLASGALGAPSLQNGGDNACSVEGAFMCSADGAELMQCNHGCWVHIPCGEETRCLEFNEEGIVDYECVRITEYDGIMEQLRSHASAVRQARYEAEAPLREGSDGGCPHHGEGEKCDCPVPEPTPTQEPEPEPSPEPTDEPASPCEACVLGQHLP